MEHTLQAVGYQPVRKMKLRGAGGGMKAFEEVDYVDQDGNIVLGETATEQAAKYAQEHPTSDASKNFLNNILAISVGLTRPLGRILWNTAKETLPWLSARTYVGKILYLTTKDATAIDAILAGSATGASIYDRYKNGPTLGNGKVIKSTTGEKILQMI